MPDYPGAVAAIKAQLAAGWTQTVIAYVNKQPEPPFPPVTETNFGEALSL